MGASVGVLSIPDECNEESVLKLTPIDLTHLFSRFGLVEISLSFSAFDISGKALCFLVYLFQSEPRIVPKWIFQNATTNSTLNAEITIFQDWANSVILSDADSQEDDHKLESPTNVDYDTDDFFSNSRKEKNVWNVELNSVELSILLEELGFDLISRYVLGFRISGKGLCWLAHVLLHKTSMLPGWLEEVFSVTDNLVEEIKWLQYWIQAYILKYQNSGATPRKSELTDFKETSPEEELIAVLELKNENCGLNSARMRQKQELQPDIDFFVEMSTANLLQEIERNTETHILSITVNKKRMKCSLLDVLVRFNSFQISSTNKTLMEGQESRVTGEFVNTIDSSAGVNSPQIRLLDHLTHLQKLNLAENALTGPIPESVGYLRCLQQLDLSSNRLDCSLPHSLIQLVCLEELNLQCNQFSGNIPSWIGHLSLLKQLDISHNRLVGNIPQSIGLLGSLIELYLSNNMIDGEIPCTLGGLSCLKYLDLSTNQLSGEIPDSISRLTNLQELHLTGNQLVGNIPPFLCELTNLEQLTLARNKFTGCIPSSLCKLKKLEFLNLSGTRLSGQIPSCLGQLENLKELGLQCDELFGQIPQDLLNKKQLIVDLDAGAALQSEGYISFEVPQFPMFVIHRDVLVHLERFVPHEQASELGLINELVPFVVFSKWFCQGLGFVEREKIVFISHRWLSDKHPDDSDNSKLMHLQQLSEAHATWEYFWFDFLSIPQDNQVAQNKAINSLPNYVKSCATFVTLCGDDDKCERARLQIYKSRGWCRLEQVSALVPVQFERGDASKWRELITLMFIANKHTGNCDRWDHYMEANHWDTLVKTELNPLKGDFYNPDDRSRVAQCVKLICDYFSASDTEHFQELAKSITSSPEYMKFCKITC